MITGVWSDVHGITGNGITKTVEPKMLMTTLIEENVIDNAAFITKWKGHFTDEDSTYKDEKAYCEENNIDIDLGAGALHADEFVCKNGTFNVGAGEVDIENGCIKNTSMDVGMGAIFYGGIIQGPLEADCGMGAITLELEGNESDYNYNIDVDAGDVQIGERSYSGIGYSDFSYLQKEKGLMERIIFDFNTCNGIPARNYIRNITDDISYVYIQRAGSSSNCTC